MSYVVGNKRLHPGSLGKRYPGALLIDVTSKGTQPWVKFSPFYPHGGIPIPLSPGFEASSVEGIWQGLKVFNSVDIDSEKFHVTSMRGLKRTVGVFGPVAGHRAGVTGTSLLSYAEARRQIYLPAYKWTLDYKLQAELEQLRTLGEADQVVLLDYETNDDLDNLAKPLSHAALIVRYLTDRWPKGS
jgi:hypothetical protein